MSIRAGSPVLFNLRPEYRFIHRLREQPTQPTLNKDQDLQTLLTRPKTQAETDWLVQIGRGQETEVSVHGSNPPQKSTAHINDLGGRQRERIDNIVSKPTSVSINDAPLNLSLPRKSSKLNNGTTSMPPPHTSNDAKHKTKERIMHTAQAPPYIEMTSQPLPTFQIDIDKPVPKKMTSLPLPTFQADIDKAVPKKMVVNVETLTKSSKLKAGQKRKDLPTKPATVTKAQSTLNKKATSKTCAELLSEKLAFPVRGHNPTSMTYPLVPSVWNLNTLNLVPITPPMTPTNISPPSYDSNPFQGAGIFSTPNAHWTPRTPIKCACKICWLKRMEYHGRLRLNLLHSLTCLMDDFMGHVNKRTNPRTTIVEFENLRSLYNRNEDELRRCANERFTEAAYWQAIEPQLILKSPIYH